MELGGLVGLGGVEGPTGRPSLHLLRPRLLAEHSNYFGVDEKLGPVAVSIKREKLEDHKEHGPQYQYRIIFRTSEVRRRALRPLGCLKTSS